MCAFHVRPCFRNQLVSFVVVRLPHIVQRWTIFVSLGLRWCPSVWISYQLDLYARTFPCNFAQKVWLMRFGCVLFCVAASRHTRSFLLPLIPAWSNGSRIATLFTHWSRYARVSVWLVEPRFVSAWEFALALENVNYKSWLILFLKMVWIKLIVNAFLIGKQNLFARVDRRRKCPSDAWWKILMKQ